MEGKLNVDKALFLLGDFALWKMLLFLVVGIYKEMYSCWQMFGIVFIGLNPPHHCALPEGVDVNTSIPMEYRNGELQLDQCNVWSNYTADTNLTLPCSQGWDYTGKIRESIVDEWDLVCDRSYYSSTSQTVLVVGVASGAFTLSVLSDNFGRKPILITSFLALSLIGFITAWTQNVFGFMALRFFTGFFQQGVVLGGFVYLCEIFPATKRALMTKGIGMFWDVGMVSLAAVAMGVTNWRYFTMAAAAPGLLALPMIWLLPETVPWLAAKGRIKDAKKVLQQAAKMSKVTLPKEFEPTDSDSNGLKRPWKISQIGTYIKDIRKKDTPPVEENAANYTIMDILRSWRLLAYSLIMCYLWCTSGLVYYGISLNISALYGDLYINFIIMGAIGIPAVILFAYLINRFGRRWPLFALHLVAGIPLAIVVFIPKVTANGTNLEPLRVTLVMIARMGIGGCFGGVFVYCPELFPTTLRNIAMGISSVGCRIGNVIAPFTPYVSQRIEWLPNVVFGSMAILAAFLVLVLPETMGRPLPTTIEEVESWEAGFCQPSPAQRAKNEIAMKEVSA